MGVNLTTGKVNLATGGPSESLPGVTGGDGGDIAGMVITPQGSDNAIIVKRPDSTYGDAQIYGKAQAFLFIKEGVGSVQNALVLARIDGQHGGIGTSGGLHISTGLNKDPQAVITQSMWISPNIDVPGIIIDGAAGAPAAEYMLFRTNAGVKKVAISNVGELIHYANDGVTGVVNITAGDAPAFGARVILQAVPTGPSITIAALHLGGFLQMVKEVDPNAPAANQARVFVRDNGAGKGQLCVRFPTGVVQVIATEP